MQYKAHYPYLTLTIDKPESIEDFFKEFHLSRKTIHLLKQNKDYTLNNRYVSASSIMLKGDKLTLRAYQQDDGMYPPLYEDLDIIYEDEFLLIVNKPAFIHVFPSSINEVNSLSNRVSAYYQQCGLNIPVRFIHRLDYETSGLVIYCKCSFVQPLLDYQLSIKEIKRNYVAIVEGSIHDYKEHRIHKPIGRDRHHNQRMVISSSGKDATTYYQCVSTNNGLSLVQCRLDTGRKHQIRVHLASQGLPLLGDTLYGKPSTLINRQALHAYQLQFIHPITKEKMTVISHLPDDMKQIIDDSTL
ncbi:MAG: RluA family pseudouridine synthase [Erysipelotrichaceae bacterium]|nr:RluA family pseudouridine synthase [Erysipelotrichaceae bacterium]